VSSVKKNKRDLIKVEGHNLVCPYVIL